MNSPFLVVVFLVLVFIAMLSLCETLEEVVGHNGGEDHPNPNEDFDCKSPRDGRGAPIHQPAHDNH